VIVIRYDFQMEAQIAEHVDIFGPGLRAAAKA
jgi:hypothetical protein